MAQRSGGKASKFTRSLERGGSAPQQEASAEQAQEEAPVESTGGKGRPAARGRQRPEKPVRITVDLDADRHRFLRRYAADEGLRGTEVVRGLLEMLEDEPELADQLSARLSGSA